MSKFFKKLGHGATTLFNKVKDGATKIGHKIESGLKKTAEVGGEIVGGLQKGLDGAIPIMSTVFPEFAPEIMAGGAALQKGLNYAHKGLDMVNRTNQAIDNTKNAKSLLEKAKHARSGYDSVSGMLNDVRNGNIERPPIQGVSIPLHFA